MLTQAPKGTKDVLPSEAYKWHYIEDIMRTKAALYGYREIRTPVFEHTELFLRSVGDTTDVVQKEMYTFFDKGERSITLKPEGTAGAVRAFIENGLFNEPLPLKMFYFTPVFRYERPQAGRFREHHQFGIEAFGGSEATLDAEIILLGLDVIKTAGLKELNLEINSIGCPECRSKYNEALIDYFEAKKESLCELCNDRLTRNPMRILDCKTPSCKKITADAPIILDYICEECTAHFETLQQSLSAAGVQYNINPRIVRGLDYYTKTVFEIICTPKGQLPLTICGGGRYDKLVGQIGDRETCGAGFGMGLERLLMILEEQGVQIPEPQLYKAYIVTGASTQEHIAGLKFAMQLREAGIAAECEHNKRSFKAQFKYADKLKVSYCVIIGDREMQTGKYTLKSMQDGSQEELTPEEIIIRLKG